MFLIKFGCDPDWVLDLDFPAFDALVETAMRYDLNQRATTMQEGRMVAHDGDGKACTAHIKELRKAGGTNQAKTGSQLVADLAKGTSA